MKLQLPLCLRSSVEKALEYFNLEVGLRAGQGAVGLLGASGAGKSMTLRMIAGIVAPDQRTHRAQRPRSLRQRNWHVNVSAAEPKDRHGLSRLCAVSDE